MIKYLTSPLFAPVFFSLIWLFWMCCILIFEYDNIAVLLDKEGWLEIVTNLGYIPLVAAYVFCWRAFMKNRSSMIDFAIFVGFGIAAFLREMGIQHWLTKTDTTAFKSRFFLNPNNPLSEKIVAGALLLILLAMVLYIGIKYAKHLIISFFKMNPITWSVATLCTIGVIAKFTDRFPSNYKHAHGFRLPEQLRLNLELIEETSETLMPLIAAFVIFQYWLINRKKAN